MSSAAEARLPSEAQEMIMLGGEGLRRALT